LRIVRLSRPFVVPVESPDSVVLVADDYCAIVIVLVVTVIIVAVVIIVVVVIAVIAIAAVVAAAVVVVVAVVAVAVVVVAVVAVVVVVVVVVVVDVVGGRRETPDVIKTTDPINYPGLLATRRLLAINYDDYSAHHTLGQDKSTPHPRQWQDKRVPIQSKRFCGRYSAPCV
jgi:glucan phosphoethanolaminetransferase (alkaline phosphatase superfamily)